MKKLAVVFSPCYINVFSVMRSYCPDFLSPGFDIRAPQDPPNMKKSIFFLYFGFKISYQIVSLFDMYMDMGERIAGKQDRPSLIIEDPFRVPK